MSTKEHMDMVKKNIKDIEEVTKLLNHNMQKKKQLLDDGVQHGGAVKSLSKQK